MKTIKLSTIVNNHRDMPIYPFIAKIKDETLEDGYNFDYCSGRSMNCLMALPHDDKNSLTAYFGKEGYEYVIDKNEIKEIKRDMTVEEIVSALKK